jgi:hypothetical protein
MQIDMRQDVSRPTTYGLIDLASLARVLEDTVVHLPPSYLGGKTAIRDTVMDRLRCSALEAERIVDRLERRGFLHYERRPGNRRPRIEARWYVNPAEAGPS